MPKEVIVESFELDHTIVKAPYVRLIGEEKGPKGDVISNYDIRLVQPNEDSIPTAGLHTIEHLLAKLIRTRIDGMIDCSPFGCRTGFHMIMWGRHTSAEIAAVIKDSLKEIAETTTWEDVPGTTIESCGNYKDHSLFSAKEWAKLILEQGISDDAFERHVILTQKRNQFFSWLLLFYAQNSVLGFFTNDQNAIFHICFQMFSI